jgi:hypothetical protein
MTKQRTNSATGRGEGQIGGFGARGSLPRIPGPSQMGKNGRRFPGGGPYDAPRNAAVDPWVPPAPAAASRWVARPRRYVTDHADSREAREHVARCAAGPALAVSSYRTRALGKITVVLIDQPV